MGVASGLMGMLGGGAPVQEKRRKKRRSKKRGRRKGGKARSGGKKRGRKRKGGRKKGGGKKGGGKGKSNRNSKGSSAPKPKEDSKPPKKKKSDAKQEVEKAELKEERQKKKQEDQEAAKGDADPKKKKTDDPDDENAANKKNQDEENDGPSAMDAVGGFNEVAEENYDMNPEDPYADPNAMPMEQQQGGGAAGMIAQGIDMATMMMDPFAAAGYTSLDQDPMAMMGGGFGGCTINLIYKDHKEVFIVRAAKLYEQKFAKQLSPFTVKVDDGVRTID